MSLFSKTKKLWDNGISKKWFLIAIFICITIPVLFTIVFYCSGKLHIYDTFIHRWQHSFGFLEKLNFLGFSLLGFLILWLFTGNIIGFLVAYNSDMWTFQNYPICTLMVCFYLICSMLRCRNMKVNVFMAFVPFYNPIALLFKKNKNTKS